MFFYYFQTQISCVSLQVHTYCLFQKFTIFVWYSILDDSSKYNFFVAFKLRKCFIIPMFVVLSTNWNQKSLKQKYSRLRCLLRVKDLAICFYLGWSGSILQFRQNMIKVGAKGWLLPCSSIITLKLPSYTKHWLCFEERERNFCNVYLSLLYFCPEVNIKLKYFCDGQISWYISNILLHS